MDTASRIQVTVKRFDDDGKGKATGLRVINIVGDVKENQPRVSRSVNGDDVNATYDSDILSEVLCYDTYHETHMLNPVVQKTEYSKRLVSNNDSYDELMSNINVISYFKYMVTIKNDASQSVPSSEQKNDNAMILSVIEQMQSQVQ
ncbi:hypothetical protein Tco_1095809 [Tanacetum coccineum]